MYAPPKPAQHSTTPRYMYCMRDDLPGQWLKSQYPVDDHPCRMNIKCTFLETLPIIIVMTIIR